MRDDDVIYSNTMKPTSPIGCPEKSILSLTNHLGELTITVDIDHKPHKKMEAIWSRTPTWPAILILRGQSEKEKKKENMPSECFGSHFSQNGHFNLIS